MINTTPIRLLIAGCGDLGLRVARLVSQQHPESQIWGLRRSQAESPNFLRGFTWFNADLAQPETLKTLPPGITHILFSAAPNARTEADYRAVYLQGLQNVVRCADNSALERILFISSSAVYGEHGEEWVDENTPVSPKNFNGRVLLEAEQWLSSFNQSRLIATSSLRLSGIYGPGRRYLLDRLKLGQASAPSTPVHWVNRIHIDDAAAAIQHLMFLDKAKLSQIYLITDSTPLPMRALYEYLAKRVGGPIPADGAAPSFVGSKRLSNARLLATDFKLKWPDSREGHASLL